MFSPIALSHAVAIQLWQRVIVSGVGWVVLAANVSGSSTARPVVIGSLISVAVFDVLLWLFNFAFAELILLAIDVANDLRINRFLLKAIRYSNNGNPSPTGQQVDKDG